MAEESINVSKISTGKLDFTVKTSGEKGNEPVILLHGFPETSHMWHQLQSDLASRGYYTLAPDQRGYSASARPTNKEAYHINELGKDIVDIMDEVGIDKFHLAGHDWGSIIAWYVAFQYPHRIKSLSALSVPHPLAFIDAIANDPDQSKKSRYMKLFQIPWLPEFQITRNNFALLKKIWRSSTEKEIEAYLEVLGSKPAIKAVLNWYRANYAALKGEDDTVEIDEVHIPTLFIWGRKDRFIGRTGPANCEKYVKGTYNFHEVDGGHWLIQTNYQEVLSLMEEHISSHK